MGGGGVITPVFMVDRCCLGRCRAARLQSNRDRLLCLRRQRSTQRTPEPSSREGPGLPKPPQYVSRRGLCSPPRLSSVSTSQEIPGSNTSGAVLPHLPSSSSGQPQADAPSSFTPTLAAHFDETLVRHIQGWPSETTEKQVRCCRGPLLLGLLPLVFLPSAVPLYPTGEASSLKWSQPSYWPFLSPLQQLKLVLLS